MTGTQPDVDKNLAGEDFKRVRLKRNVVVGLGALLGLTGLCTATIMVMLHHLEARNASFHPPMTALERQEMLPADPVMESAPQLNGLRYGVSDPGHSGEVHPMANNDRQFGQMTTAKSSVLRQDLRVTVDSRK